ncbi:unnamed protein product [Callosobruchus maculatus]|uniref:Protein fem-1 homolog B n=1 Tax=Callosobruchus maculatus TaxID=64391 RepID=A0A653DGU9_CALMS|nr:unnamed protein product [Callosobruchus maculatus]
MCASHDLKSRIYYAAKDGMSLALFTLLNTLPKTEAHMKLNQKYLEEDGQEYTPLIVAARYGNESVVRILLSCDPNLEVEGTVKFDGYIIEGASALWVAACAGHLNIVKLLIKHGADVNHATKTNSTPLRAACFDGRLDIVRYLTKHKADIHIANKYNNTCLMIASYKGHLDVVSFLLETGADPNEKALCGATALHFAAECGYFSADDAGMTPIMTAAERSRGDVVEYLVERPEISLEERIEALELLGASYANDKENYNLSNAYFFMHASMKLRYSDPDNPIKKKLIPPIPAYENWLECQTLAELEAIEHNSNSLHMEALTIRERVLGSSNPEVPQPIIYRGAIFADNARFDRCLELWLHALKLRQKNYVSVAKDLLRFAQVFSQMLHVGTKVSHNHVIEVLAGAILELERNKAKLTKPGPKDEPQSAMVICSFIQALDDIESNLISTLYLLTILTRLMKQCSEEEKFNIGRMVFTLNQLQVTLRDGQSLLHLACNAETPVDEFHTNDVCKFPCAETTKLLITCGADVNAMDVDRNTPLHMIVNYHKAVSDFMTLYTIITALTEGGAHLDCVNGRGETPLDASATGSVAEIILKTQMKLSLKCLAANAVKRHRLTYRGLVPKALECFIELHGSGTRRA